MNKNPETSTAPQPRIKPKRGSKQKNVQVEHSLKISELKRLAEGESAIGGLDKETYEMLEEHLRKFGRAVEDDVILSDERAERMRRKRENLYGDVLSLLKNYRRYRRLHDMYIEELSERSRAETGGAYDDDSNESAFENLAKRLELMDTVEERKFVRSYQPYIEQGYRIEKALKALEYALNDLKDEEAYNLIYTMFIDESRQQQPKIREICSILQCSPNKYYTKRDKAVEALTMRMFGIPGRDGNKDLRAILAFLHVQSDERLSESALIEFLGA